jgi:hypothetical protein
MKYEKTFLQRAIPSYRYRSTFVRFMRGTVAGMVAMFVLIAIAMPSTLINGIELKYLLLLSFMYGSITGIILAMDKWKRVKYIK